MYLTCFYLSPFHFVHIPLSTSSSLQLKKIPHTDTAKDWIPKTQDRHNDALNAHRLQKISFGLGMEDKS